jgi:hypothetical protein
LEEEVVVDNDNVVGQRAPPLKMTANQADKSCQPTIINNQQRSLMNVDVPLEQSKNHNNFLEHQRTNQKIFFPTMQNNFFPENQLEMEEFVGRLSNEFAACGITFRVCDNNILFLFV